MIWLLSVIAILLIGLLVVDWHISAPGHKGEEAEHFDGKKFHNPDKLRGRGLSDMVKLAVTSQRGDWSRLHPHELNHEYELSSVETESDMTVTFVNHSTFLVQLAGLNILTDPIWSNRASPYSWVGPKRMRPPGVRFEDLPSIDLVLLSHNHYDHLDLPTVQRLSAEHNPLFITPSGVEQFLNKKGIKRTLDLDWWQGHSISEGIDLTAVPAQHFSGRGVFDRDQTHWCGYVLQTAAGTLYYAGDTAYGNFFTGIGNAFDIDLSLIPIGAYKPRWFMETIHVDPDEAIQIHLDVQSAKSIGCHFGTFPLAKEAMHEPEEDLAAAKKAHNLDESAFIVINEGKPFRYQAEPLEAVEAEE